MSSMLYIFVFKMYNILNIRKRGAIMHIGELIKKYRIDNKLTMEEMGKLLDVSKAYISMLEKNKNSRSGKPIAPSTAIFKSVANLYNISLDDLLKQLDDEQPITLDVNVIDNGINFSKRVGVQIPILGSVIAGTPISAIEDILGYEEITPELASTGTFFCLKVKGNSMEPRLFEDDIIVVKQQPDIESGDVAVVLVNGDEATVKQIKKADNGITLIGYNVAVYPPTFYSNEDIINLPVTIIGKVIELRRPF